MRHNIVDINQIHPSLRPKTPRPPIEIKQVRINRDINRVEKVKGDTAEFRSKGYGFVEFTEHVRNISE